MGGAPRRTKEVSGEKVVILTWPGKQGFLEWGRQRRGEDTHEKLAGANREGLKPHVKGHRLKTPTMTDKNTPMFPFLDPRQTSLINEDPTGSPDSLQDTPSYSPH